VLILHSGRQYGPVLHGSATTTHAIRAAIQRSKAPLKDLAARYGLTRRRSRNGVSALVSRFGEASFLLPRLPRLTLRRERPRLPRKSSAKPTADGRLQLAVSPRQIDLRHAIGKALERFHALDSRRPKRIPRAFARDAGAVRGRPSCFTTGERLSKNIRTPVTRVTPYSRLRELLHTRTAGLTDGRIQMVKLFAASVAALIIACVAGWAVSDSQARVAASTAPMDPFTLMTSAKQQLPTDQFADYSFVF
jgi:hypothetical protein